MGRKKLQEYSIEELKKSQSSNRTLFGIFIPVIIALFYFSIDEYLTGEAANMPNVIIIICSIGGMVSLWPTLKAIKKELKSRES